MDVTAESPSTPLRAGFRSLILPGWGQLANRHRLAGWMLILASVTVCVAALMLVRHLGPVEIAARLADPEALLLLLGANLLIAGIRLVSTEQAWWAGGGRSWFSAMVLATLVLIPHVAVAWVGAETRHTLLEVFGDGEVSTPDPPAPPVTVQTGPVTATTRADPGSTTSTTTTITTTTLPSPTGTLPLTPSLTPPTAPPPTTPFQGVDRLNLLLLGGDAGPGRSGLRTDTTMIASVDPATGDAALIGLPRNYSGLSLTDGTELEGLIFNEVYEWGRKRPELFGGPDPGASAVGDVATFLTGLDIDYFVLVDLTGFAEVVDAFGGVTLTVPRAIYGPLYDPDTGGYEMITIPTGHQTLTGAEALAYSRARLGSSDYARMGRQRCVLAAMVEDADPFELVTALPDLLDTMETHLTTDLPLELVPDLIRLVPEVSAGDIRVIGFDHTWRLRRNSRGYAIPDIERIRAAVDEIVNHPDPDRTPTADRACA